MPIEDREEDGPGPEPVFRVDGAHRLGERGQGRTPVEAVAVSREVAGQGGPSALPSTPASRVGDSLEQMQVQAEQLARHLQDRRREVDYREAQLNARLAQVENELRGSRLWLQEQQQEFAEREEGWRQQLANQEARAVELVTNELALEESRRQMAEDARRREDSLARREFQLQDSQQRLALEASRLVQEREHLALERQQFEESRVVTLHRDVAEKWENLRNSQQEQLAGWQREHEESLRRLAAREAELTAEYEALRERGRQWQQEREQQQQILEEQRLRNDQRQIAVERVRGEMMQLHRESLEMRLIAEQLWAELVEQAPAAEVSAGMSRLRCKLADTFRLATTDLETQRRSVQELLERLDGKQQELIAQRHDLLGWFARRQQEIAQQSSSLSDQERQNLALRRSLDDERAAWLQERRQLQRQLADLQGRLVESFASTS